MVECVEEFEVERYDCGVPMWGKGRRSRSTAREGVAGKEDDMESGELVVENDDEKSSGVVLVTSHKWSSRLLAHMNISAPSIPRIHHPQCSTT
jgi:hypothetical protein